MSPPLTFHRLEGERLDFMRMAALHHRLSIQSCSNLRMKRQRQSRHIMIARLSLMLSRLQLQQPTTVRPCKKHLLMDMCGIPNRQRIGLFYTMGQLHSAKARHIIRHGLEHLEIYSPPSAKCTELPLTEQYTILPHTKMMVESISAIRSMIGEQMMVLRRSVSSTPATVPYRAGQNSQQRRIQLS